MRPLIPSFLTTERVSSPLPALTQLIFCPPPIQSDREPPTMRSLVLLAALVALLATGECHLGCARGPCGYWRPCTSPPAD